MKNLSTVRNLGKLPRVHAPKSVQIRGAGFNKGGWDSKASNNVKPVGIPRLGASSPSKVDKTSSYLPQPQMRDGGKVPAMAYGKGGKVVSCQNY